MSSNLDNEILQDFLIEAGEILEKLAEQLVELEQRPADKELLNAVFRGFHTVKGGAGFLDITALVEICHVAEDIFNTLRQGLRSVDAELMDAVLKVTDVVNSMIESVKAGQRPESAGPEFMARLRALSIPQQGDPLGGGLAVTQAGRDGSSGSVEKDAVERQFEAMLGVPDGGAANSRTAEPPGEDAANNDAGSQGSETITDEEFEALLDQLHGKVQEDSVASIPVPAPEKMHHGEPYDTRGTRKSQTAIRETEQQILAATAKGAAANQQMEASVRVDTKRLDDMMNLVGELVLVRNRLDTLKVTMGSDEAVQAVSNLDLVTSDLQAAIMKTRMQPIKKVFSRFPRVVRDLSRILNKEINLELIGEDTELDKSLVEALADPLVHLVRNAIDHGIEMPDVRQSAGKPRAGTISLSARQEGDHILLKIGDDGAGMDANKLRSKVVENGLMDAEMANRLDERECFNLIFMAGFSTKSEISDISGRGVGMDVVKTKIAQLNGSVEIDSKEGKGTEIIIKLPLTLAIVPTLMIMVGGQIFAIPLVNVSEIVQYETVRKNIVDGQAVAIVRDHPLPLFYLRNWLLRSGEPENQALDSSYILVINCGMTQIACVVDHLIAQEEVVIKPLGALLHGLPGLSGATITGNGRIAIILDMPSLISCYARRVK